MLSRLLTTREQIILSGLAVAILSGAVTLFYIEQQKQKNQTFVPTTFTSEQVHQETDIEVETVNEIEFAKVNNVAMMPHESTMQHDIHKEVVFSENKMEKIGVAIMGAVHKPGFYWMPPASRVDDLLKAGGGPADTADLRDINPAAWIIDGTTLTVPELPQREVDSGVMRLRRTGSKEPMNPAAYSFSGIGVDIMAGNFQESLVQVNSAAVQPGSNARSSRSGTYSSGHIAINRATQAELETLPGIGPALAGRIIQYRNQRPFQSLEDLLQVSGIGPQRFEAIRDLVTLN